MKPLKILFLSLFLVVAVIGGGLIIFVATFDANHYKQQIINLVKKQTGRELSIDGDLKLAVYPDLSLAMGKTSLSNAAGFSGTEFATIGSANVSVELIPLLKKQLKVDHVLLNDLKLNLQRKADGSSNWDDLVKTDAKKSEEQSAEEKSPSLIVQEMLDNLSIAGVNLNNAQISWRDDLSKQNFSVAPLNLKTGVFKPGKPLPVDFSLVMTQKNPAMSIAADGSTTVTLSDNNQKFSLAKLKLHSKVSGAQIPNGALEANISGNIDGSPVKIMAPDLSIEATLTGDLIPQGSVKTRVSGNLNVDMNTQQISIAGLKLDSSVNGKPLAGGNLQALVSGDAKFNLKTQMLSIPNMGVDANLDGGYVKGGAASTKISGNTQFDLARQFLTISGMKLDGNASGELLKGGTAQAQINGNAQFDMAKLFVNINAMKLNANANGGYLQVGKADAQISGDMNIDLANSQLKSPQVSINSHLEGGLVPGGKLDQQGQGTIDLNWANNQGAISLSSLLVKLADMELKGSQVKIQPLQATPGVSGQFQTNTFNLKQALKLLGITPPVTKNPNALSKIQAQFSLKADTANADLQQLKAKLDNSTLSGNLTVINFNAPAIKSSLSIDRINIDDYLSQPSRTSAGVSAPAAGNQELLPIETLRKLDIDSSFNIGSMVINKINMSKVNARIVAKQGLVTIDPANASLYQGAYEGRITLDTKQAVPTMKMHHELVGLRSEGLLFDLFQDKYISGDARLVTDLGSRGNTINALLQNLNGKTEIAFKDGTIRDSNFAEKVSLAVKAFEKKEIEGGKTVVTFTGLSGDWNTTNGVFKTENLSLLAPYFKITGKGIADVARQTLDMNLRIGPNKEGEDNIFAPLHITGTFSDPKFQLDLKELVKALAQKDLEKVKAQAKEKLEQAKKEAQERVALEKQKIQQRVEAEAKAKEQALRNKVEDAKNKALEKVEEKVGKQLSDKLGDQLKNKLGGGSEANSDANEEKPNLQDQVKDKLKDKLKGLF